MLSGSGYRDSKANQPFQSLSEPSLHLELGKETERPKPRRYVAATSFLRARARAIIRLSVLGTIAYFLALISIQLNAPKLVVETECPVRVAPKLNVPTVVMTQTVTVAAILPQATKGSASVLFNSSGTATFRENLLPSTKYVTTFLFAGFTNQFMEITSLIYLALLTSRVPIIPAFLPDHFGSLRDTPPIKFGDVFDLPYLIGKLGFPLAEWHELKQTRSDFEERGGTKSAVEKLGCWSISAGNQASGGMPSNSDSPQVYGLDVSWTPVPSTFTLTHGADPNTNMWSIWALASLGFAGTRARVLPGEVSKSLPLRNGSGQTLEPDQQLLCFDLLYWTGVVEPYPAGDFFADYSPYWNRIGIHMRWKQSLADLAEQYLRHYFQVQHSDPIPLFISVHVRHTDFGAGCKDENGIIRDGCFAPITAYEQKVNEVKGRLQSRKGLDVLKVIVSSDEPDPKWWDQVAALGPEWGWINHTIENTVEKYGKWYLNKVTICEVPAPFRHRDPIDGPRKARARARAQCQSLPESVWRTGMTESRMLFVGEIWIRSLEICHQTLVSAAEV